MGTEEKIGRLQAHQKKLRAYKHAMNLLNYDGSTLMPSGGADYLSDTLEILSGEEYSLRTAPETGELLRGLSQVKDQLDFQTRREVEELLREQERLLRVPKEEVMAMESAASRATACWQTARKNDDFQAFAPHLEKLIEMKKRYAGYIAPEKPAYDVLMDDYERGMNQEDMDAFFGELKAALAPLIGKLKDAEQPDVSFMEGPFDVQRQKALSQAVMDIMGLDRSRCVLGESAHPFTTEFSKFDVRITTRYAEDDMASNLYSVIHEGGHAMYELSISDGLAHSVLGEGDSTAIHESQSRLWENYIGRSQAFCGLLLPRLKELFPAQFAGVTEEGLYRAVNMARPSLIRTEADELTYSLHVLIRYEIEKQLIEEDLDVEKLPQLWADKYEEYLGVRPENPAQGVLQDIHWSQGSFGYFPSYALGSAFGAQLYYHMKQEMDFEGLLEQGKVDVIREYLRENIHQYGKLKDSRTILKDVTGEDFDPKYYVRYLKEKYGKLYEVEA